jgi:hypothetical protein
MRTVVAAILGLTVLCWDETIVAQEQSSDTTISGNFEIAAPQGSVEQCWTDWLKSEDLTDGKNLRGDGSFLFVSKAMTAVNAPVGAKNWVAAREAAFNYAELSARQSLAEMIRTLITSDRQTAIRVFGGDQAPPSLQAAAQQLSLSDKVQVLSDKALDAEIKKYDPKWDGNPATRAEEQAKLRETLEQNMSASATLFASGAFTPTQCEGPSTGDAGKYSVLVGLVWSPVLQKLAETIWDSTTKAPPAAPDVSLAEHFDQFSRKDPDWMWVTDGARIFTDERGDRIVVGFGVAPTTSLAAADQARARLHALTAIQRFVGEKIVSTQSEKNRFEQQELMDASATSFDQSVYENSIKAIAKDLQLVGASEVGSWRGEHPWGKVGMQVVAMAWSEAWSKDSAEIGKVLQTLEMRMQNKGAVPDVKQPQASAAGPAATKAKRGASSSTKQF